MRYAVRVFWILVLYKGSRKPLSSEQECMTVLLTVLLCSDLLSISSERTFITSNLHSQGIP